MKNFIYDFFSLSSVDIDKWSKSFFWPISRHKTQKILTDILDMFMLNIKNEDDPFIKKCMITYNQNYNPYVIIFNYILLKKRISMKNYRLIYSDNSEVMKYLFKDTNKFPLKVECFKNIKKQNYVIRLIKDFFKTISYNFLNSNFLPQKSIFALNQIGVLEQEYFKNFNEWVSIISAERIKKNYKTEKISEDLKSKIYSIHEQYIKYSDKELNIKIPKFVEADILKYQIKYFTNIYSLLKSLSENRILKKTKKIYIDYPKTIMRAISLIVKDNGGKVYGFPHGSWICHSLSKKPCYNEFLLFDYYLIYNDSQKNLFHDNLKLNYKNSVTRFISQNSKIFQNYQKKYKYNVPHKINSIMILEHQLWCDDIRFELPETMIIFEFYYYLCSLITSLGYKIYFKKRPKSQSYKFNFFKNITNFEMVDGDIQDSDNMSKADVIIFMYGMSSTFIPLVCSSKRLIYFDNGWEKWNPKIYSVLQKRCGIIKTFNNKENKIRFKVSNLTKILNLKKKKIDSSFYDKFLSI